MLSLQSEPTTAPRWARAADSACLLLLIVAAVVAASGGFRLRIGPVRIGVTSPYPLLVWAAAVAVVRHVVFPRHPIYADLPQRIAAWCGVPAVQTAARVAAGSRTAMMLVGYLGVL